MDEKKVMDAIEELRIGIKTCKDIISYNGDFEPRNTCERLTEKIRNFETAIEALEKQLPMKPNATGYNLIHYKCTKCKTIVPIQADYCKVCGQRLDWSEVH